VCFIRAAIGLIGMVVAAPFPILLCPVSIDRLQLLEDVARVGLVYLNGSRAFASQSRSLKGKQKSLMQPHIQFLL